MTQAELDALQVGDVIAYSNSDLWITVDSISHEWKIIAIEQEHNYLRISNAVTGNIYSYRSAALLHDSWEVHKSAMCRDMYDKLADILGQVNFTSIVSVGINK